MMFTSKKKIARKSLEHAKFMVKYALRMREDVMSEADRNELTALLTEIKTRLKTKQYEGAEEYAESCARTANRIHPAPNEHYGARENIEVFAVVISVVMAFRTFVAQPYQIPTGSMQPTLYGITAKPGQVKDWTDAPGPNLIKFALTGGWYQEYVAEHTGELVPIKQSGDNGVEFQILGPGGRTLSSYVIHKDYAHAALNGHRGGSRHIEKGETIVSGVRKMGDHVIVNRLAYNFTKPRRGDVVVFSTKDLGYVRPNSSYIKRLVGMPGETIRICDRKLYADGELVTSPANFPRQYEDERYAGYGNGQVVGVADSAQILRRCNEEYTLGEDQYLFLGDNTDNSLDGRWFGGVPGANIIGPAVVVPWPFFDRGIYGENAGPIQ